MIKYIVSGYKSNPSDEIKIAATPEVAAILNNKKNMVNVFSSKEDAQKVSDLYNAQGHRCYVEEFYLPETRE